MHGFQVTTEKREKSAKKSANYEILPNLESEASHDFEIITIQLSVLDNPHVHGFTAEVQNLKLKIHSGYSLPSL